MQRSNVKTGPGMPRDYILQCWLRFRHRYLITQMKQHFETRSIWTVKFHSWQPWAFSCVSPVVSNVERCWKMSREFSCHLCAEFFDNESDLQRHLTARSSVAESPKCDRVFSKKSNLKAHLESVHREGASKFICHPCQKSFSNSSNLKRHLASTSHSGVDKSPETKRQRPPSSTCASANVRWVFAG